MREGRTERNKYAEHRASANFSSSGHPVRPPRRARGSGSDSASLGRGQAAPPTEKYYFGAPVTVRKLPGRAESTGGLGRSHR